MTSLRARLVEAMAKASISRVFGDRIDLDAVDWKEVWGAAESDDALANATAQLDAALDVLTEHVLDADPPVRGGTYLDELLAVLREETDQ